MDHEGDYHEVFHQLADRSDARRKGRESAYRPWLIICSGTMRGIYGGGQVSALEEREFTKSFAGCVGISTGAPTAAYFLAGQARLGTTIYSEECTWPAFIDPKRMVRGGHGADIGFLADVFRGRVGDKRLDEARIRESPTEFLVAVTEREHGLGRLVDGKTVRPDIVHGLAASAAIPGMYRTPMLIGSRCVVDGGLGMPLPITQVLQRNPTSILVLANCSRTYEESLAKWCATWLVMRRQPRGLKRTAFARHRLFDDELEKLRSAGVPYTVLWSDDTIGSYTRDPQCLEDAANRARLYLHNLMDRAGI